MTDVKIGIDLDPTQTSWTEMRRIVELAERVGIDSLWTWDHLYGLDDPRLSIIEAWTTIAAWAAITTRPTIGLLVGANTLRNPGLLSKSAVTVDHISEGRCVLGLGSGWRPREHLDHGIPFGSGPGERLEWLEESVAAVRGLLAGHAVTSPPGGHYAFQGMQHRPLPFGGPGSLPILIGGGGLRRTLPLVARYADLWHHRGDLAGLSHKLDVLRSLCASIGRDPEEIELTFDVDIVIRDDVGDAHRLHEGRVTAHYLAPELNLDPDAHWFGPPEAIAERWRPFFELGFRHLIVNMRSPYDEETVQRLPDVKRLIETK